MICENVDGNNIGRAIYIKTDGSRYDGHWPASEGSSYGRLIKANGYVYEGEYNNN